MEAGGSIKNLMEGIESIRTNEPDPFPPLSLQKGREELSRFEMTLQVNGRRGQTNGRETLSGSEEDQNSTYSPSMSFR